ncbi:phosphoribosylanthranilate isomerase [Streptomyces sp. NBC_00083]|uniref:phosphoribosylanthranilate isomerase n=1 Tax=Streptomyces sp. NBC_00083 TaxID=2975647 RepID=UPI0022541696|nr:phosphoribosylanthranilate isomerase [Streptomyces sp. NBC_00083]MCX5384466.1 phosphoribosylanthranilate isomerase [Streptomyces sp. NBC_00083]
MSDLFVKICGLRTPEDVDTCVEAGADAIGFVFAPSVRTVEAVTARRLAARVPSHVLTVGVFRGQPLPEVCRLTEESGIGAVQLHGDEGPEYYEALRAEGRTLIRATTASATAARPGAFGEDLLLLDAPDPGSGKPWNWASPDFAAPDGRWILAGGLHPGNVRRAVEVTGAWGVDVSSGVERERGVKSSESIREFIKAARS